MKSSLDLIDNFYNFYGWFNKMNEWFLAHWEKIVLASAGIWAALKFLFGRSDSELEKVQKWGEQLRKDLQSQYEAVRSEKNEYRDIVKAQIEEMSVLRSKLKDTQQEILQCRKDCLSHEEARRNDRIKHVKQREEDVNRIVSLEKMVTALKGLTNHDSS